MTKPDPAFSALRRLLESHPVHPDAAWFRRFLESLRACVFDFNGGRTTLGRYGIPFLVLDEPGADRVCRFDDVVATCVPNAAGAVVMLSEETSGWVFTYGDLWGLREYGALWGRGEAPIDARWFEERDPEAESMLITTPPSEGLLPLYVRPHLAAVLRAVGVSRPRAAIVVEAVPGTPQRIQVNLHPEDFPGEAEFDEAYKRISFFLPASHWPLCIGREHFPEEAVDLETNST